MRQINKILIDREGKRYLIKDLTDDFHTAHGVIKSADLRSGGSVKSTKGRTFFVLEPEFVDIWESIHKGPQKIISKDIGLILAKTGVNKESAVVDAGGGAGSLALALANVCQKITVYERNPEHFRILAKNVSLSGLKNIALRQEDVYEGIREKNLNLITLDLPEPWRVNVRDSLKPGGFLVVYLPNLTQVKMFVDSANQAGITVMETVELLERRWKIEGVIMRPEFEMLGHTGFLTFCRNM